MEKRRQIAEAEARRPAFLENLREAYGRRKRNVILLTGDIQGPFWDRHSNQHVPLENLLQNELGQKFNLIRFDSGSGLTFYDEPTRLEVTRICESPDGVAVPKGRDRLFKSFLDKTQYNPLVALTMLQAITEAFSRVGRNEKNIKPLGTVIQYAGALFPSGEFSRLNEVDRQRLVQFLNWISSREMASGDGSNVDLVVLIAETKSEVSDKILLRPNTHHIEIPLPNAEERSWLVKNFTSVNKGVRFEGSDEGRQRFVEDTTGLSLANIKDILETAHATNTLITRKQVSAEVSTLLEAQLGHINIRISRPAHTPKDIIGYAENSQIFSQIFQRCEDSETAISAIVVSGPNGGGKNWQVEAHSAASGRTVIELPSMRGSLFGETDKLFEMMRWYVTTFGKVTMLVDEAHTAFGSAHTPDMHPTERRLAGNFIKMMGDPKLLGKVLWILMTSRPDSLDPDIKSRAPVQIPVFDLTGKERNQFVAEMFKRKRINLGPEEFSEVMFRTTYYSARDYRNLLAEIIATRRRNRTITVLEIMSGWQASRSIIEQRRFQELIAVQHCSYPQLIPERYRSLTDEQVSQEIGDLRRRLRL